jgi:hypothetical protein
VILPMVCIFTTLFSPGVTRTSTVWSKGFMGRSLWDWISCRGSNCHGPLVTEIRMVHTLN